MMKIEIEGKKELREKIVKHLQEIAYEWNIEETENVTYIFISDYQLE